MDYKKHSSLTEMQLHQLVHTGYCESPTQVYELCAWSMNKKSTKYDHQSCQRIKWLWGHGGDIHLLLCEFLLEKAHGICAEIGNEPWKKKKTGSKLEPV
jgi:hypothetical protein